MKYIYKTPGGISFPLFDSMLSQPHLLIAGATGSGKSVVVRGIIQEITLHSPVKNQLVLIDPKRVELAPFRALPHCIRYSSEPGNMIQSLEFAMNETERRYKLMQRKGLYTWEDGQVYVIIDELADLMTTQKKAVSPLIQRLAQVGRAAGIHLVACTQCPIAAVIPTQIKVNFDARIALRCRSPQDSRNILGTVGAEKLPRYGEGLYLLPEGLQHVRIPFTSSEDVQARVKYWKENPGKIKIF